MALLEFARYAAVYRAIAGIGKYSGNRHCPDYETFVAWRYQLIVNTLLAVVSTVPSHSSAIIHLFPIDIAILLVYLLFVIGIGVMTGKGHQTSEDFFLSGRRIPAWITGLAFISANLGALEVMGMSQ
ncbi:MAG: hypothetical protein ACP5O1_12125, partial [Phycisphaerae bacterium]